MSRERVCNDDSESRDSSVALLDVLFIFCKISDNLINFILLEYIERCEN